MPKIPMSWLGESVALGSATPEEVAAALVKVGLEEEGISGGGVEGPLVVGRVLSLVKEAQKNGKTINYCRVDVGADLNDPAGPGHAPDDGVDYPTSRGIVCGAHNFVEGDYVVVVLPGGVLPGPFPIGGPQDVRSLVRWHDLLRSRVGSWRGPHWHHRVAPRRR